MATLKKLSGDRAQVCGSRFDGVYVRVVFSLKRHGGEYLQRAKSLQQQLIFETSGLVDPGSGMKAWNLRQMTVAQLADRYGEEHLKKSRASGNLSYLKIIKSKWGDYRLQHINIGLVRPWLHFLLDEGKWSASTVKKIARYFQRLFSWACEMEILAANPLTYLFDSGLRKDFRRRIQPRRQVIPETALMELAKSSPDYLRRAILLAWYSGMREGELCELRWSHFLEERLIHLPAGITKEADGKSIVFDPGALPVLDEIKAEQLLNGESEYVLLSDSGRPMKNWSVSGGFRHYADKANLKQFRFHDIRRSYVDRKRMAGIDPRLISAQLGHHSQTITEQHYSRGVAIEELKRIACA